MIDSLSFLFQRPFPSQIVKAESHWVDVNPVWIQKRMDERLTLEIKNCKGDAHRFTFTLSSLVELLEKSLKYHFDDFEGPFLILESAAAYVKEVDPEIYHIAFYVGKEQELLKDYLTSFFLEFVNSNGTHLNSEEIERFFVPAREGLSPCYRIGNFALHAKMYDPSQVQNICPAFEISIRQKKMRCVIGRNFHTSEKDIQQAIRDLNARIYSVPNSFENADLFPDFLFHLVKAWKEGLIIRKVDLDLAIGQFYINYINGELTEMFVYYNKNEDVNVRIINFLNLLTLIGDKEESIKTIAKAWASSPILNVPELSDLIRLIQISPDLTKNLLAFIKSIIFRGHLILNGHSRNFKELDRGFLVITIDRLDYYLGVSQPEISRNLSQLAVEWLQSIKALQKVVNFSSFNRLFSALGVSHDDLNANIFEKTGIHLGQVCEDVFDPHNNVLIHYLKRNIPKALKVLKRNEESKEEEVELSVLSSGIRKKIEQLIEKIKENIEKEEAKKLAKDLVEHLLKSKGMHSSFRELINQVSEIKNELSSEILIFIAKKAFQHAAVKEVDKVKTFDRVLKQCTSQKHLSSLLNILSLAIRDLPPQKCKVFYLRLKFLFPKILKSKNIDVLLKVDDLLKILRPHNPKEYSLFRIELMDAALKLDSDKGILFTIEMVGSLFTQGLTSLELVDHCAALFRKLSTLEKCAVFEKSSIALTRLLLTSSYMRQLFFRNRMHLMESILFNKHRFISELGENEIEKIFSIEDLLDVFEIWSKDKSMPATTKDLFRKKWREWLSQFSGKSIQNASRQFFHIFYQMGEASDIIECGQIWRKLMGSPFELAPTLLNGFRPFIQNLKFDQRKLQEEFQAVNHCALGKLKTVLIDAELINEYFDSYFQLLEMIITKYVDDSYLVYCYTMMEALSAECSEFGWKITEKFSLLLRVYCRKNFKADLNNTVLDIGNWVEKLGLHFEENYNWFFRSFLKKIVDKRTLPPVSSNTFEEKFTFRLKLLMRQMKLYPKYYPELLRKEIKSYIRIVENDFPNGYIALARMITEAIEFDVYDLVSNSQECVVKASTAKRVEIKKELAIDLKVLMLKLVAGDLLGMKYLSTLIPVFMDHICYNENVDLLQKMGNFLFLLPFRSKSNEMMLHFLTPFLCMAQSDRYFNEHNHEYINLLYLKLICYPVILKELNNIALETNKLYSKLTNVVVDNFVDDFIDYSSDYLESIKKIKQLSRLTKEEFEKLYGQLIFDLHHMSMEDRFTLITKDHPINEAIWGNALALLVQMIRYYVRTYDTAEVDSRKDRLIFILRQQEKEGSESFEKALGNFEKVYTHVLKEEEKNSS